MAAGEKQKERDKKVIIRNRKDEKKLQQSI